jgi:hypothetical protein
MKYENLLAEKEKLQNIIGNKSPSDEHQQLLQLKYKTYQLEQENKELKKKLHLESDNDNHHRSAPDPPKTMNKSFREQIPVSDGSYKIPIDIRNKMVGAGRLTASILNSVENFQIIQNEQSQNVLQQPIPGNGRSSTTTTTPTSIVKKENLVEPPNALSTSAKTSPRVKPLPKGENDSEMPLNSV